MRAMTAILFAVTMPALAQESTENAPVHPVLCEEAITVFHDISRLGRKDRAASNMTRRHAEMAQDGWRFADMEPYTENSDLEGFFLTYRRNTNCAASAAKNN